MRRLLIALALTIPLVQVAGCAPADNSSQPVTPSTVATSSTVEVRDAAYWDESQLDRSACVRAVVEYGEYVSSLCEFWQVEEDAEELAPFFAEFYGEDYQGGY